MLFSRLYHLGGEHKHECIHIADAHTYTRFQIRKARLGGKVTPSDFVDPMLMSGVVAFMLWFLVWCIVQTVHRAATLPSLISGYLGLVGAGALALGATFALLYWVCKFVDDLLTKRADISAMQFCSTSHWPLNQLVAELKTKESPDWNLVKVAMMGKTDLSGTLSRAMAHFVKAALRVGRGSEPIDVLVIRSAREIRQVLRSESEQQMPTPVPAT